MCGFFGVALGAFGAHGLNSMLVERGMLDVWKTAVEYQLTHAVALLALAAWVNADGRQAGGRQGARRRLLGWAAGCWGVGVALFSGSLYVLALVGPRWIGPVTPVGGVALLTGWVLVAVAAVRGGEEN